MAEQSVNDSLVELRRKAQALLGEGIKGAVQTALPITKVFGALTKDTNANETNAEPIVIGEAGEAVNQFDVDKYNEATDYPNIFEQPETTPEQEVEEPESDFALNMPDLNFGDTYEVMDERKNMLKTMEGRLQELRGRKYQTDLTPFLSFVDATTGSNMAQSYKAPQTREERDKLAAYIESRMGAERRAIGSDLIKMQLAKQNADYKNMILKIKQRSAIGADPEIALKARKDARDQELHEQKVKMEKLKMLEVMQKLGIE